MTFSDLALIVVCGLAGPALGALRGRLLPVVVGEIAAGVAVGVSGTGWLDPTQPTTAFLGQIGFAMLMFVVGTRLPLREPGVVGALRIGAVATAVTAALAVPAGLLFGHATGIGHPAMFAVLLSTGSAAVALPIVQERGLAGPHLLPMVGWIVVADIVTVLAVPVVLATGSEVRVVGGAAAVTAAALGMWALVRALRDRPMVEAARKLSKHRRWALDLRLSLAALFVLTALATRLGTSILVAGFAAGAVVAMETSPKRLTQQVVGLAEGFFVPLFFVLLGAQLDVRGLAGSPGDLALTGGLAACVVLLHGVAARIVRLPPGAGLVASAQLGVPAAVVAVALEQDAITASQGAAIIVAALLSLLACSAGAALLARSTADVGHLDPVGGGGGAARSSE